MDKPTLIALCVVAAAVVVGTVQVALVAPCAGMRVEANDPGEPANESSCVALDNPAPFVLLGFMALAGAGIALGRAVLAWSGALLTIGGCVVMGFSWGGFLFFHGVAVLAATTAWHLWGDKARPRMGPATFAAVVSLPLGLFGVFTLATATPVLFDPCHEWDDEDGTLSMSPDDPCRSKSSFGDVSREEYVLQLVGQHVVAVVALALAVVAAWRRSAAWALAAGVAWATVVVAWMFGFGLPFIPFALLAAVACLVAAWRLRARPAPPASLPASPPSPP